MWWRPQADHLTDWAVINMDEQIIHKNLSLIAVCNIETSQFSFNEFIIIFNPMEDKTIQCQA